MIERTFDLPVNGKRRVFVPLIGWIKSVCVVMDFAAPSYVITVVLEIVRKRNDFWIRWSPPMAVAVESRG